MQIDIKNVAAGGIFILIAALFALGTMELTIGTPLRMGPGFFPLLLAGVLAFLGVIILLKGFAKSPSDLGTIPWRGGLFILTAPIVFGMTVRGFGGVIPPLGLVPSVALAILIASFASRRTTVAMALTMTVVLTIFCLVVFQRMLGLPVPPFGGPLEFLNPYVDAAFAPFGAAFAAFKSLFGG
ncbi:tripartite tricarboxylate transporter TctB family protein [Methylopila sp. M107]|uniref:tripartite tricarboxylate transporter TctB family protein n=1 Tax=Methylopila sp. M107 TaxID=1101190 RepID=UPI0003A4A152|nr:tripartite tricarboxylate transporter TctB family protein [Methylopila sp. M107]